MSALLADGPVDPLAEEVCMTVVTGVLLDHVDEHFAKRDLTVPGSVPRTSRPGASATNRSA